MQLTRAADYAIRMLLYLAGRKQGSPARREDIVANTGVPKAFLNKLVQRLVHAGLVAARPGVGGGCALKAPAEEITILRIMETIDGPLRVASCLGDPTVCGLSKYCQLRTLLLRLQEEMARVLGNATLASVAREGPCCLPGISMMDGCRCDGSNRS
jgi:Rrf2 family protein